MSWARINTEYPRHRKTIRLVSLLGAIAELYPIRLWLWAAEQSPNGCLHDLGAAEVASIVGHAGDAQHLMDGLVSAGFVERDDSGVLWIRSWEEHQGQLIEQREKARERWRRWRDRKVAGEEHPTANESANVSQTVSKRTDGRTDERTNVDERTDEKKPAPRPARAGAPPAADVVLEFSTVGKVGAWQLTRAQLEEWATLYPGLDVERECRKAAAWIRANSGRRKTAGGMARFLVTWLNRAVDDDRRPLRSSSGPALSAQRNSTTPPKEDPNVRRVRVG